MTNSNVRLRQSPSVSRFLVTFNFRCVNGHDFIAGFKRDLDLNLCDFEELQCFPVESKGFVLTVDQSETILSLLLGDWFISRTKDNY